MYFMFGPCSFFSSPFNTKLEAGVSAQVLCSAEVKKRDLASNIITMVVITCTRLTPKRLRFFFFGGFYIIVYVACHRGRSCDLVCMTWREKSLLLI